MAHLLNWLWQGTLVALAAAVLLAVTRRASARARYRIAAAAFIAVMALPLVAWRSPQPAPAASAAASSPLDTALVSLPNRWWTSDRLAIALCSLWAAVAAARAAAGLAALGRARRSCCALPAAVESRLARWRSVRDTGRRARLAASDAIRAAAVFAGPTPVIAVNPLLAAQLSDEDLDRVIVHEWMHVQRRDDLACLLQLGARIVAGWHPAVWWLDRALRFEREVACDERAVELTGSARAYAGCLLTLADLSPTRGRALPIVGAESHLRRRVARILCFGAPRPAAARLAIGAAGLLPLVVAGHVADLRLVASMPATVVVAVAAAFDQPRQPEPVALGAVVTNAADAAARQPSIRVRRAVAPAPDTWAPSVASRDEASFVETTSEAPDPISFAVGVEPSAGEPLASGTGWPVTSLRAGPVAESANAGASSVESSTLWDAAATGGVAIGRGSQQAAVTTAGLFTRVGKSIAGAFTR